MMIFRRTFLTFLMVFCWVPQSWGQQQATQSLSPLRLGVHPYLPALYLKQRFTPLTKYLSKVLGREVKLMVSPDYRTHIMRIAGGEVDIAYMGPASYVKLVDEFGVFPLIARQSVLGQPEFNGVIVVRDGSRVTSLADLKGSRFAFGDPSSTMSHLVPRYLLLEAGVGVEDLAAYKFVGSHQDVALAVLRNKFDAGAVKQEVYARYRHRGLRSLMLTPQISEHLFVARKGVPEGLVEELRTVFWGLDKHAEGRQVLRAIKKTVTAMVPVSDSDYDNLRTIILRMREEGVKL